MSNPSLKIVSAYHGLAHYVSAAKSMPHPDLNQLWLEYAIEPFWAEWAQGQFNEGRTREQMKRPITRLDELAAEVECLRQSGIECLVEKAYSEISGTPSNTAYTIGYHIVQAYLEAHPTRTVLELMDQDAQTILTESGYRP